MQRLFNNTLFTSLDYGTLIVLNLVATPLLIANFGTAGYGAFVFLSIFSVYGALAVFDLGMEGALMNYVARFEASGENRQIQNAFTLSILFYGLVGLLLGTTIWLLGDFLASRFLDEQSTISPKHLATAITFVAVNVFVQFLAVPSTALLQGLRKFHITKSVSIVVNLARYGLVIAVAVVFQRIDYAFMVVLILSAVRLLGQTGILLARTEQFNGFTVRLDLPLFKTLINYSSILFVTRIIGLVHNQTGKILIWYYLTAAVMAVYDVVARPAMLLRVITSVIVSAVIPETARLHQLGEKGQLDRMLVSLIRYSYLITLPLLAFLGPNIENLISLWVGSQFRADAHLSLILLAGFLVLPLPSIANTMMVGLQKVRQTIWIPIAATSLNLILSVVLLQSMGLAGLLTAVLVSQLFGVIPYAVVVRRYLGTNLMQLILAVTPCFLMAAAFGLANLFVLNQWGAGKFTWLLIGSGLLLINYWLNWKILLSAEERQFLLERLSRIRRTSSSDRGVVT